MTEPLDRDHLIDVAIAAIQAGDHALGDSGECGRPDDQAAVADAVISAVMPLMTAELDALRTRVEFAEDKLVVAEVRIAELSGDLGEALRRLRINRELAARLAAQLTAAERERDALLDGPVGTWRTAAATMPDTAEWNAMVRDRDRLAAQVREQQADCAGHCAVADRLRGERDEARATIELYRELMRPVTALVAVWRSQGADLTTAALAAAVDALDAADAPPVDAGTTEPESAVSVDAGPVSAADLASARIVTGGGIASRNVDLPFDDEEGFADLTFAELADTNRTRCQRWHPGFPRDSWTGADWSNAMQGEAGEAGNVVKKLRRAELNTRGALDPSVGELRRQLGDEIADTVIYADLLAQFYGLDLAECIARKFNAVSIREGFPERLPTPVDPLADARAAGRVQVVDIGEIREAT